jgi:predicted secreted protein
MLHILDIFLRVIHWNISFFFGTDIAINSLLEGRTMRNDCVKMYLVVIPLCICATIGFAQAPDTLWTRTYGGEDFDAGYSVQQTFDGGYVIAGYTHSFGSGDADVYIIKTDTNGDTLWTRVYGDTLSDRGYSIQQTSDSGYVIAGETESFGAGGDDVWLIKTDSLGDTLWTRTYGGTNDDAGNSVLQTADKGYIIAGYTSSFGVGESDVWLIKTDSLGDTLWTRTYGGVRDDKGKEIQLTSDGGYAIVGGTRTFTWGNYDLYLILTDSLGDTLWTRHYGSVYDDYGYSLHQTFDSVFIVCGYARSFGSEADDMYLLKTTSYGGTFFQKTYGGPFPDRGYSVRQTSDSCYIVVGFTHASGEMDGDVYLVKIDPSGHVLWSQEYGGAYDDEGWSVKQTSDGGYVVTGVTGLSAPPYGLCSPDVYLIKTAPDPGVVEKEITPIQSNNYGATIFTGPLLLPEGKTCKVFDITGRTITPDKIKPGIYFIEIEGQITQKVIKV